MHDQSILWDLFSLLKHVFHPHPHKLPEEEFQALRGRIIFAVGETEIRNARLARTGSRDEIEDIRIQSLWRDVAGALYGHSKEHELADCCQQLIDVLERSGLDIEDDLSLAKSYLDEIKDIADKMGFDVS